jgi:hypothetical protein
MELEQIEARSVYVTFTTRTNEPNAKVMITKVTR